MPRLEYGALGNEKVGSSRTAYCRLPSRPGHPKRRRPASSERGFNLIELMLSSFVFTVGALGLIALIYSSAEGVTASQKITQATTLARNKLDELLRTPYDDSALAVGEYEEASNIDASGAAVAGDFGANDGNFARSWQVALPDATVGFKTINVRVRWWDGTKDMERSINVAAGKSE